MEREKNYFVLTKERILSDFNSIMFSKMAEKHINNSLWKLVFHILNTSALLHLTVAS